MKYRNKQTGEVVEADLVYKVITGELIKKFDLVVPVINNIPISEFHANYEPLEEGGQDD